MIRKDILDRGKGEIRKRFYGRNYHIEIIKWLNWMLSNTPENGGIKNDKIPNSYMYKGSSYINNGDTIATIDHKPMVVEHWNTIGRNDVQKVRYKFYNGYFKPEENFQIIPLKDNASEGGSSDDRYSPIVGEKFRGEGDPE